MKAYVYNGHGGPEVEALADVPRPEPGPGQLLVAVDAAGVNPADWKRRAGGMRDAGQPAGALPAAVRPGGGRAGRRGGSRGGRLRRG